MTLQEAIKKVDVSEHTLTRTRLVVLEAIFAKTGPFSPRDLISTLVSRPKKQSVNIVTIYRSLAIFEKLGILVRCFLSQDEAYYEVIDDIHAHRHHIVCRRCHKVAPLDFCVLDGQEQVLKKLGYSALDHHLEYTGICPKCSPHA